MQISKRSAGLAALFIAGCCAVTLVAQTSDPIPGSLGELTAEIRLLRAAIEESSRTQTQAQALGIFLSAQQSRLMQVTGRVDSLRRELDALSLQSANHANQLASIEEELPRTIDPQHRAALEDQNRAIKLELKRLAGQEQQVRTREFEASQAWQQEEARWNDLISRLQQIVSR